jgi:hypothetical protein
MFQIYSQRRDRSASLPTHLAERSEITFTYDINASYGLSNGLKYEWTSPSGPAFVAI